MSGPGIRIGTRGSALARAQTALVAARLEALGVAVEVVTVHTSGDRARETGSMVLERGAWVNAIERALVEGRVDLAVHSAKDLPTGQTAGTTLAAFPLRADARDAIVSADGAGLAGLAPGARVGTESPRRKAFVLRTRPDLEVVPIQGNVDTRLARLDAGEYDALVIAVAGLDRLERTGRIAEVLEPSVMLPAVGQGALAVQARADGPAARRAASIDDPETRAAVVAERAFLAGMGGGCRAPFAALGRLADGRLTLVGAAIRADGAEALETTATGPAEDAEAIGRGLARELLERGAPALIGDG